MDTSLTGTVAGRRLIEAVFLIVWNETDCAMSSLHHFSQMFSTNCSNVFSFWIYFNFSINWPMFQNRIVAATFYFGWFNRLFESINQSIHQATKQPINQWSCSSVNGNQSINQSINRSFEHCSVFWNGLPYIFCYFYFQIWTNKALKRQ